MQWDLVCHGPQLTVPSTFLKDEGAAHFGMQLIILGSSRQKMQREELEDRALCSFHLKPRNQLWAVMETAEKATFLSGPTSELPLKSERESEQDASLHG